MNTGLMSALSISIWSRSEDRDFLTVESCSNIYQQISALNLANKFSTCSINQMDRVVVEALFTILQEVNRCVMLAASVRNLGQVNSATNPEAW